MAFTLRLFAFYLLCSIVIATTFDQAPILTPNGKLYTFLLGHTNLVQSATGNTHHAVDHLNTPVA